MYIAVAFTGILISFVGSMHSSVTCQCSQVAMVKPGDASMASPFTAKQGHIMPCTDILKQGRSTLVTTVQMFKILGLLCLSTAYSLSVMYLQVSLAIASALLFPTSSCDDVAHTCKHHCAAVMHKFQSACCMLALSTTPLLID